MRGGGWSLHGGSYEKGRAPDPGTRRAILSGRLPTVKSLDRHVTTPSAPSIPWQLTGNHWLAVPCVHPGDGSVHLVSLLHRGARSAIEFAGTPTWADGTGPALLRPSLVVDGVPRDLGAAGMAWERAYSWVPSFASVVGDVAVQGTLFCPIGRDADVPGLVYVLTLENRGDVARAVEVAMEGALGSRELRVRTSRPMGDGHRVHVSGGLVLLEGERQPGLAALALGGEDAVEATVGEQDAASDSAAVPFRLTRRLNVAPGQRVEVAFYLAAAPERDGAAATVRAMRARGWRSLLASTRDALASLEQSTGSDSLDRIVNRNLVFAYFYGVGRALDDAHFYVVRSRAPWSPHGLTLRDWEALNWTIPAVQLADAGLARELLLRVFELHGYAPGRGVNYLDGTMFTPGFSLEALAGYAIALDRYIRDTGDDQIVEDAVVGDTLYILSDDLAARRHARFPVFNTDVEPDGRPAALPYTLHGNAVAAQALDILRRTLDEETARSLEDPEAVRAAVRRYFTQEVDGKEVFVAAADLTGRQSEEHSPAASLFWLPVYEMVTRDDSTYRRSARRLIAQAAADEAAGAPRPLVREIGRLFGPDGDETLRWLRRAPLDGGTAAELVDAEGRAVAGHGDASLAGLLAYTVWYAAHALGLSV